MHGTLTIDYYHKQNQALRVKIKQLQEHIKENDDKIELIRNCEHSLSDMLECRCEQGCMFYYTSCRICGMAKYYKKSTKVIYEEIYV